MRLLKKCFTLFTVIATIVWSAGLPLGLLLPKVARADDPLSRPHIMGARFINEGTVWAVFNEAMATTGLSATNTAFYTLITATSSYGVASSTHQISIDANPAVSVLNASTRIRITAPSGLINPATDRMVVAADTDGTCNAAPSDTTGNCNDNSSPMPFNFPPSTSVSISEVRYANSSGVNATTDEFIELYNSSNSLVSLNNWRLRFLSATGTSYTLVANLGAGGNATSSIASRGFYLVAGPNFVPAGTGGSATSTAMVNGAGIEASGTIILEQIGGDSADDYAVKDMLGCSSSGLNPVIYEMQYATCPAAGQSLERKAQSSATSASMSSPTDATNGNGYDSNNNSYDFVTRAGPTPQNHASAIETITGVTNAPPFVDHTPVASAFNNLSATLFARMGDQETSPDSLTAQLKYSTSTSPNYWLAVTGSHIANNLFKFDVPTSTFRYYMKVADASSASKCLASGYSIGTDCTSETAYQTNAWSVAGRATGTGQISGTARTGATAVSGATVIAYGVGLSASTVTAADGTFSFTTLPAGSYKIVVVAASYTDSIFDGISTGATNLAVDMYSGGGMPMYQGGDMTEFRAMFSMPGDGMQGAPTNINVGTPGPGQMYAPIMIGLSKEATTSTVTTSSVLLKKLVTGNWTAVSGYSIAYQPAGQSVTIDSVSYQWGPNAKIVVYSATALSDNSQYMVEILPSVRDTSGNPLQGNRMGGGHSIMFSTSMGFISGQITTLNFGQSAAYMPPMVTGSTPAPGTRYVARNARLTVSFSEAMNSGSLTGYVQLYALDSSKNITGPVLTTTNSLDTATNKILTIIPASNLTASTWYRLKILGGLRSANGVPMSQPGQETNSMYQTDFETSATTDTTAPSVLGTSLGMYKITANPNCSVASAGCITGVPAGLGGIDITFSKDMSPSTITTTNIVLLKGTSNVTATVSYDPMSRSARLVPSRVLDLNTDYTLIVYGTSTSAITVGDIYFDTYTATPLHALQSNYTAIFTTTATADTGAPRVDYANADDYTLAISFSEPMNATALGSNTSATTTSVLNPANYALYTDAGPPPAAQTIYSKCGAGNDAVCATLNNETGLTFSYDGSTNTVTIKGLALSTSGGFRVYLSNVTDLSGNTITNSGGTTIGGGNMAGGGVQNSATTFGMMGPGSMSMTGAPTTVGGAMMSTGFGGNSAADMGMKPISVMPMNMMAGANSTYMVDLPIGQALALTTGSATSSIVFTFPSGFDVSGAKSADPNNIYAHKDINGPGTGVVKLLSSTTGGQHNDDVVGATATVGGTANDGITVNAGARNVTVYLGNVALAANDFIHLEIDGIKNATMAKDSSTSGYTVSIKTKVGSTIKESLSSMPFFLQSAGKYVITGTVTLPYPAIITELPIYIGSPMTGPMKITVSFANSTTATFSTTSSIPGLPSGNFNVFTDPLVTPTSTDFMSDSGDSRPIFLNDGSTTKSQGGAGGACEASDTLCYVVKNIIYTAATSKPRVTVKIKGNFSGANAGKVDIFAGGSGGYSFKTLTMDENYSVNATSTTFTLPGTGSYMLGMGPAMPRGPMMMSGPMVMPSWIPPKSVDITAGGVVGAWTWLDPDTDGSLTDDASANNGIIVLSVSAATKQITGHVYGKSSDAIANAEVFANSPQGGFGTRATSQNDGSFTLYVGDGLYMVGSFMPGMPPGQMKSVEVRTSGDTTSYYVDGVLQSTLDVVLTMSKESYTISGKVTDASSNVVKDASVFAYRTDGPGHSEALTDSSGKYILYTGNGTWRVGAFIPSYGRISETTVIVSSASQSNINLSPDTTTYTWRTIEGIVFTDDNETGSNVYKPADTEIAGAFVRAVNNRTGYVNDTVSMASGTYKLTVPDEAALDDTYTIYTNVPGKGELTPLAAADVDDGNLGASALTNPKIEPTSSVTINVIDADGAAYTISKSLIDVYATGTKYDSDAKIDNATSTTMNLPGAASADTAYKLDVEIPGIPFSDLTITGADYNSAYKSIIVNGTEIITIQLPTLYTVTSTIQDASSNAVPNAMVSVYNPTTGVSFESQANASGTLVLHLPATSTAYIIKPEKSGYVGSVSEVTVSANTTVTLTDTAASYTIGGTVYIGSTGAANASVYGKKLGGGYTETTADANGVYSLPVTAGSWRVYAIADGYQVQAYSATVPIVIAANVTGKNITLSTAKSGLATTTATPVTPSNGGTLYDASSGLNLVMPPSALGVDTSSYQMQNKETSNAPALPGARPLGGEAKEISAFNNSGQPISTLNDDMTLELTYTAAELSSSGVDTLAEFNQLKSMYFDSTAGGWARIPTTIMALDSDGLPVEPNSTLSNVITAVVKGIADHLTVFGVTGLGDDLIPKAPTGASASAGTQQVSLSWTAVTKNTTESNISDLSGYEIYRSLSSGGTYTQINTSDVTGVTYTDTGLTAGTIYYYKITAGDTNGNESDYSSAVSATPTAPVTGGGGGATYTPPSNPAVSLSSGATKTSSRNITLNTSAINATLMIVSESATFAGMSFEAYASTKNFTLSAGNGVKTIYVKFRSASGGETTTSYNIELEGQAIAQPSSSITPAAPTPSATEPTVAADIFKKVWRRAAKTAQDQQALQVLQYGLKPGHTKVVAWENAGVAVFKKFYKRAPASVADWNIVYATAYFSGSSKLPKGAIPAEPAISATPAEAQVTPAAPAASATPAAPLSMQETFAKAWGRSSKTAQDQQALQVLQYDLKPGYTQIKSWEAAAIKVFVRKYKRLPSGADWKVIHAIAYFSGVSVWPKGSTPAEPNTSQ